MKPITNMQANDFRTILQLYGAGDMVTYNRLSGGFANTNYFVKTSAGEYVLTICDNKSFAETKTLADVLVYLEHNDFETSKVVTTIEGNYVSVFNDKPVLLKKYIAGSVHDQFNDELLLRLGNSLGRLHQLSAPEYLPKLFPYGEQYFSTLEKTDVSPSFSDWLAEKHEYIKNNISPELPKSFIHGDLFPSNVIVSPNGAPIIMDFEEACLYYRVFDLGMAIVGVCSEGDQVNPDKIHTFIKGYLQVIDLSIIERKHLKAFIVYAAVATAFWRFRQFNILFPAEELANSFIEMQHLADQVYAIPNREIIDEN